MNRELSSFDIHVIVSELKHLKGGYIDKIYQPTRDELLIRIKKDTGLKESLFIRNSELICRTEQQIPSPLKPSMFTITLRKHLQNGKIHDISQYDFDRIIKIQIQKQDGLYTLVLELFKNGNFILVDPNNIIIRPLKNQEWTHRRIRPKEPYKPPPTQPNPFTLTLHTFTDLLKSSKKDLVRTLATTVNLSGTYAEELCARTKIEKNTKTTALTKDQIQTLFSTITSLLSHFTTNDFHPVAIKQDAEIIDLLPFPLVSYEHYETFPVDSLSRALETFIHKPLMKQQGVKDQHAHIEKMERQLQQQKESIESFRVQAAQKQREGDLLYVHLHTVQRLLDEIHELLELKHKEEGIKSIQKQPLVKTFDLQENNLIVSLTDPNRTIVELPLDFRKTATENAQLAYQESKKYKEKIVGAQKAIAETKGAIKQLKDHIPVETKTTKQQHRGKQYWFETYRWCLSSQGNVIVAGRDAKSNDTLIKKYLKEEDRYIHADIHGAPSCIVKNQGYSGNTVEISEQTLQEACIFAASYSKAWKQYAEAQAYWVLPEQVSKTPESGEFLPKGGFVIRGKRNYYRCILELAIGQLSLDESWKLMAGPLTAVQAQSEQYVVIRPGATKLSTIARLLAKQFDVSTEDIQRVLPPGDVQIIQSVGIDMPTNVEGVSHADRV